MKEIKDYTEEVRRRYEVRSQTRRQHRLQTLTLCLPLVLCSLAGTLVLPPLLSGTKDFATQTTEDHHFSQPDAVQNQTDQTGKTEDSLKSEGDAVDGIEPPADFSFSFVWDCYGISSYDSASGKLVKTSHATYPEDYITTLNLTAEQREQVWLWLSALELETFPAEYDPYNPPDEKPTVFSKPNRNLVLTLRQNGKEITVACRGICLDGCGEGYDARARAFLQVCDQLTDLLTHTPEWESLPDYEFYYE